MTPCWIVNWTRCTPDKGETRTITGETLNPPFTPSLHHEELPGDTPEHPRYQGRIGFDPIDASIAASNSWLGTFDDPRPDLANRVPMPTNEELEAEYNIGKPEGARTKVYGVKNEDGAILVVRSRTPYEARKQYQDNKEGMPNSYHSAIVSNQEHHRWVTAMDVAIGQAKSLGNAQWRTLLFGIADWRTDPEKKIHQIPAYSDLP